MKYDQIDGRRIGNIMGMPTSRKGLLARKQALGKGQGEVRIVLATRTGVNHEGKRTNKRRRKQMTISQQERSQSRRRRQRGRVERHRRNPVSLAQLNRNGCTPGNMDDTSGIGQQYRDYSE
jgi:hypothetical protein